MNTGPESALRMSNTSGYTVEWTHDVQTTADGTNVVINNHHTDTSYDINSCDWDGSPSPSISASHNPGSSTAADCNESKAHNNDEKALFHGLKSAYRMSRTSDGEYGTHGDPPYETAARIAANVAIAYLLASDQPYTREESLEYIEDNYARSVGYVEKYFSDPPLDARVGEAELEDALDQAWHQVDEKWNHYDAARTALAAAELFLSGELEGQIQALL